MPENVPEKFIQISLHLLRRFTATKPLDFDIYVKRTEEHYTKIFREGDILDWDRISTYEKKGITFFFVEGSQYSRYTYYVERLGMVFERDPAKFNSGETIQILKEMVNFTIHEIVTNHNISEKIVDSAGMVMNKCISSLEKDPKFVLKIVSLLSTHEYLFKHSFLVGIFSVILAKGLGIESESSLNIIGLGAFLHDIGLGQLSIDTESKDVLSPEERKEIERHPVLGRQLLEGLKGVRTEVLDIVHQHHEMLNGHGYPNALRESDIYPPAKIVAIADTFSSLITKRPFRDALKADQAYLSMESDIGKFDRRYLKEFGKLLFQAPKNKE